MGKKILKRSSFCSETDLIYDKETTYCLLIRKWLCPVWYYRVCLFISKQKTLCKDASQILQLIHGNNW